MVIKFALILISPALPDPIIDASIVPFLEIKRLVVLILILPESPVALFTTLLEILLAIKPVPESVVVSPAPSILMVSSTSMFILPELLSPAIWFCTPAPLLMVRFCA